MTTFICNATPSKRKNKEVIMGADFIQHSEEKVRLLGKNEKMWSDHSGFQWYKHFHGNGDMDIQNGRRWWHDSSHTNSQHIIFTQGAIPPTLTTTFEPAEWQPRWHLLHNLTWKDNPILRRGQATGTNWTRIRIAVLYEVHQQMPETKNLPMQWVRQ